MIAGLDQAGKTTFLNSYKLDKVKKAKYDPTLGYNHEEKILNG
jgi:GTPase SAR1 family protein